MRQSFSEVQDPLRPMQAPSGQLVHHLQRGADAWRGDRLCGAPRVPAPLPTQLFPSRPSQLKSIAWWVQAASHLHTTHLPISRLQSPRMAGQALTAGSETATLLRGARHRGAGGAPTAQPGKHEVGSLYAARPHPSSPEPRLVLVPPGILLQTTPQHRTHKLTSPPPYLVMMHIHLSPRPQTQDSTPPPCPSGH